MLYSYNGILFAYKKEWSADTCYNIDKPWRHYAKSKKPATKGHDSIHMKCLEHGDRKRISGGLGLSMGNGQSLVMDKGLGREMMKIF